MNALRSLSYRDDHDYDYILLTTKIMNGNSFLKSLNENLTNEEIQKKLKRSIFAANNMME